MSSSQRRRKREKTFVCIHLTCPSRQSVYPLINLIKWSESRWQTNIRTKFTTEYSWTFLSLSQLLSLKLNFRFRLPWKIDVKTYLRFHQMKETCDAVIWLAQIVFRLSSEKERHEDSIQISKGVKICYSNANKHERNANNTIFVFSK